MVRRRLRVPGSTRAIRTASTGAVVVVLALAACGQERDMVETMEMPDTAQTRRALDDPAARDALLDTLPGGEMVRGESAAEQRLLTDKMP